MPKGDDRRVWIGWTSNWLYAKDEPTVLWRGAQSIPRSLTLRRIDNQVLMVQAPVRELDGLREGVFHLSDVTVEKANAAIAGAGLTGEIYEIEAEIDTAGANEVGFRLRKGDVVETVVGVQPVTNMLFVDRTKSGNVSFSKDFPGRFSTILSNMKRVKLYIFVDRSSVEVFANDGEKVMTNRIYPPPGSTGIELYSIGGAGRVVSLSYWPLQSIWGSGQ